MSARARMTTMSGSTLQQHAVFTMRLLVVHLFVQIRHHSRTHDPDCTNSTRTLLSHFPFTLQS